MYSVHITRLYMYILCIHVYIYICMIVYGTYYVCRVSRSKSAVQYDCAHRGLNPQSSDHRPRVLPKDPASQKDHKHQNLDLLQY